MSLRPATASTYVFRVRILGGFYAPPGGPSIWRELELAADQTLAELGERIPAAFGFDDHLWSFFLSGKPWDSASEYARLPDPPLGEPGRGADGLRVAPHPARYLVDQRAAPRGRCGGAGHRGACRCRRRHADRGGVRL
jgi:hypothetical protein